MQEQINKLIKRLTRKGNELSLLKKQLQENPRTESEYEHLYFEMLENEKDWKTCEYEYKQEIDELKNEIFELLQIFSLDLEDNNGRA